MLADILIRIGSILVDAVIWAVVLAGAGLWVYMTYKAWRYHFGEDAAREWDAEDDAGAMVVPLRGRERRNGAMGRDAAAQQDVQPQVA